MQKEEKLRNPIKQIRVYACLEQNQRNEQNEVNKSKLDIERDEPWFKRQFLQSNMIYGLV